MTKITRYPAALDSTDNLPDIASSDRMNDDGIEHDVQHTLLNQAVIELQKKVGADETEDDSSLEFRVKLLEAGGGGGGSGLIIGGGIGIGGDVDIPEKASVWLQVTVAGVDYVVPGFEMKHLLPPRDVEADSAILFMPTRIHAHDYRPFFEEE